MIRLRTILLVLCLVAASGAGAAEQEGPIVLTGTQATYSLTVALSAGTNIKVRNVPADGRQLSLQKDYFTRRAEALAPTFRSATAVVSLTNALPGDPLFRVARNANIRVVDIEAALPWSLDSSGVALADSPRSTVAWGRDPDAQDATTGPYFWLSISNSIRMADIIAADLQSLFPPSGPAIIRNLDTLKRSLLQLRGQYQGRLIEAGGDVVFALTGDFVYLTNDMGLLVDGYFIKQDLRWTPADLTGLTMHLRDKEIKVVLHKWLPSEAIQKAVRDAGATLVVLDAGDPGVVVGDAMAPDGLQQILRKNLESILTAFKAR